MSARLAITLATVALAASAALAPTAAAQQVNPEGWYLGPRISVGSLNGATAIGAEVDRAFTKPGAAGPGVISGGIAIDYYTYSYNYFGGYGYKYSVTPVQVFGAYHYILTSVPKLDPYAGVGLVYSIYSNSYTSPSGTQTVTTSPTASSASVSGFVGARYFLSNNFAVNAQAGFGYTNLSVGVGFKF
jgi:hypothetical protein